MEKRNPICPSEMISQNTGESVSITNYHLDLAHYLVL